MISRFQALVTSGVIPRVVRNNLAPDWQVLLAPTVDRKMISDTKSMITGQHFKKRSSTGPFMRHSDLRGVAVSTDESRALTWSNDGTVRLWNLATGEQIGPSPTKDRTIIGGAFSSNGRKFLFWSGSTVEVWDAVAVSKVGDIDHGGLVAGAQFSSDGDLILSWSIDGTLKLSDSQSLEEKVPTMQCRGPVAGASFSHDGDKIVSWSDDQLENGTIRLWNSKTGSELGPPMRTEAFSYGAAFSPNDERVISWFADGGMRLLDSDTGYQLGPTMRGAEQVNHAQFSSDGKRVVASLYEDSKVGSARVWDVDYPAGNIVRVACSLLNNFSVEGIEKRYAVKVADPICAPDQLAVAIDWRAIERAPQP